jgi:hypothetical protein
MQPRLKEDGWTSYGITIKGKLVVFMGTWRVADAEMKLREE